MDWGWGVGTERSGRKNWEERREGKPQPGCKIIIKTKTKLLGYYLLINQINLRYQDVKWSSTKYFKTH